MTIRWSLEAWEALYPDPSAPGWKPWPHLDEFRERNIAAIFDACGVPQPLRDALMSVRGGTPA